MQKFALLLSMTLMFAAAGCKSTSEPVQPTLVTLVPVENEGMHARNVELAQRAKEHPDAKLVFLGDSITQGWEGAGASTWRNAFGDLSPLNLGVSGDRTEHVLWRLAQGDYDALQPKAIVIMIGTNNTGHRMDPPADIAAGVTEILAQLKSKFPKARLVLLAIFPRGEQPTDPGRVNNAAVNALLIPVARQVGAEWMDISRAFTDANGVLAKSLMPDFLHPNTRGYEIWANAIREPLKNWLQ